VLVVNALSIPITIRYLGAGQFGIWMTISTILSMLLVLDLGVANSLTNFVSEAYAKNDRDHASTYATTAFAVMVGVAFLLGVGGWLLWPHLNWDSIFHLSGQTAESALVGRAVAGAFCVFLLGLPASLAPKILGGYQELRVASFFQALGSVCNLLFVVVLTRLHAGLVALVVASSGALVAANFICLFWVWFFHKPWLFPRRGHLNRAAARRMLQTGSEFFLLQLAALVVFNSDNLVVTHYLGPVEVASYSVAWRLVGYAAVAQTLLAPALWPAFSEAFSRGDMAWVRRTFARTMWITMGIAIGLTALFAVAGRRIIEVWAGRAAVPSQKLMLLMCLWTLISTFMNNTSTLLVSKGDSRLQAYCSLAAAALNLMLSVYWVQRIGAPGVILATIVSYAALLIVPQTWKVYRVLTENGAGIGNA
jgi:O-antigen/teichoic acid export membrane protein